MIDEDYKLLIGDFGNAIKIGQTQEYLSYFFSCKFYINFSHFFLFSTNFSEKSTKVIGEISITRHQKLPFIIDIRTKQIFGPLHVHCITCLQQSICFPSQILIIKNQLVNSRQ